jgi:hypothetical protein
LGMPRGARFGDAFTRSGNINVCRSPMVRRWQRFLSNSCGY